MGFSLNPMDAISSATDALSGVVESGAEAFQSAVSTASDVISNASLSDIGHTILDGAGMVPVLGEAADLANGAWYAAEGDWTNAALSAGAAVPFLGNAATAAKWGNRAIDAADTLSDVTRTADNVTDAARAAPDGSAYSVAYQTQLDPSSYPGVSRGRHFQEANENLLTAMDGDPAFAQSIGDLGINLQRTPTGLAPRTSPDNWTWHHAAEPPGSMQLVPRDQHAPGSIFQDALHPGGVGGYSIWGK